MTIGSLGGIANSMAGAPLAQTKGADVDRAAQEAGAQQHQVQSAAQADSAAGIGETDGQEHATAERDADGRLPWRRPTQPNTEDAAADSPPRSRDTTGQTGSQLDLSG